MIRRQLMRQGTGAIGEFRMRGTEITRLEGFSDAVFGFAVTLLVVSLEVPSRFNDLVTNMRNLLPFGVCFALLCYLWYRHYIYFRRYGLEDVVTVALNVLLLFVILAYVYPLKFLFRSWLGVSNGTGSVAAADVPTLYIIYGLGWTAVYVVFALLYVHAWREREALKLNDVERFDTLASIWENLATASIGLVSCLLALFPPFVAVSAPGWIYFGIAIVRTAQGTMQGKRRRALVAHLQHSGVKAEHGNDTGAETQPTVTP